MASCGKACGKYKYFSLQYGGECFCGNSYGKYKKDKSQTCGGKWANSVFRVRRFAYLGCFKDKSSRDIKSQQSGGNGSRAKCGATCAKKGMKYFGLQYGKECFCGNSYGKYKKASNCNMKCGNGKETCGGTWANSVYQVMKKSRRLMSAPMRSLASKTSNLYASVGCYKDKRSRDLKKHMRGTKHTMESCGKTCAGKKYKYFSLQYGGECFCGNSYGKYKKASNCNMKCKKDKSQTCGGKWANSVFRVRRFAYLGCFKDKSSRDIKSQQSSGNGSKAKCGATCAKKGMKYFGLQYGKECFCGNSYGKYKKASNCNMKCGNGKETC